MRWRSSFDTLLDRSLARGQLIELQRSVPQATTEHGFVVGIGPRWVLLHVVKDGIALDGYQAVRHRDIARARRATRTFTERLLEHRGQGPVVPRGIDLDRTRDLLRTATKRFRVVAVHPEYDEPDVCYIGEAGRFRDSTFGLHEVSPEAEWLTKRYRYPYRSISRVDFDGAYERALVELADASSRSTGSRSTGSRRGAER